MALQKRNPVTGWWERVPEPRLASVWASVTYACIACAGLAAMIISPVAQPGTLAGLMTLYWAGLLVLGGTAGAVAVLPGLFWLERVSIVTAGAGLFIFLVALGLAVAADVIRNPGAAWPVFFLVAGLLANIAGTRWARVRHGTRDPERFSTYPDPHPVR